MIVQGIKDRHGSRCRLFGRAEKTSIDFQHQLELDMIQAVEVLKTFNKLMTMLRVISHVSIH